MTATPTTPTRTPAADKSVEVRLNRALVNGTLPKDLLVVGPAGSGKTLPILTFLHRLAADHDDLRMLICRQTRASLTASVLVTFEQEVLPADGMESLAYGVRRNNRQSYVYPSRSEIALGGMDRPDRVLSTAWDLIYFNEAIEGEENAWETLASRLGRPGRVRWLGNLIGDTNPGDPSHWLKRRCDDGRTVLWEANHRANPAMWDGRAWTEAGRAYNAQLDRLRGTRRKRLKDGLWAAGEGQWFAQFDPDRHVTAAAEYDPRYPVHLSVDTGSHTGGVLWQIGFDPAGPYLGVFGDYYDYNTHAFEVGRQIVARLAALCGGRFDVGRRDPSGAATVGFGGQTIASEFERAGLKLHPWPRYSGSPAAGLTLLESFVSDAADPPRFRVHPRCKNLVDALANYKRKKRGGQFIDEPEDPQHPYEEVIDALRSGLLDKYPEGRKPEPLMRRVPARSIF